MGSVFLWIHSWRCHARVSMRFLARQDPLYLAPIHDCSFPQEASLIKIHV